MPSGMPPQMRAKYAALKDGLSQLGSALVAFSGGVDSSLVAFVAAQALGEKALAVTSASASLKRRDLQLAKRLAEQWGMRHRVILTDELAKPAYRANPVNRCFHCKTSLYASMRELAAEEGFAHIANGTNLDDLDDHRPGLKAAADFAVQSPLVDAGFAKADVRLLAAALGLDNADKPQSACLSSRFPYGAPIDEQRLAQVERAENALADLGFAQCRVRHHEQLARLEIAQQDMDRAFQLRGDLEAAVKACGYRFVALDLSGFRSGALNAGLIDALDLTGRESLQRGSARGNPSHEKSLQPGSARGNPPHENSPQPGSARGSPSHKN